MNTNTTKNLHGKKNTYTPQHTHHTHTHSLPHVRVEVDV